MADNMRWYQGLKFQLGGSTILVLVLSTLLVVGNIYTLRIVESHLHSISYIGQGRTAYRILYFTGRLAEGDLTNRSQRIAGLQALVDDTDRRLGVLLNGDTQLGIDAATDPLVLANLREQREVWQTQVKPVLERVLAAAPSGAFTVDLDELEQLMTSFGELVDAGIRMTENADAERLEWFQLLQLVFSAIVIALLLVVFWLALAAANRTRALAKTAERISAGELTVEAPVSGSDELALLGNAFNTMTAELRGLIENEKEGRARLEELISAVADTTNSLSSAAAEILASTSQQAAGMREQSSAVAETVTTVDEILQTSEQAAQRARAVADSSQKAAEVSSAGRRAVDETVSAMITLNEHTGSLADSILNLAEHGQAIGEIIAAVTDIADQTNLLALNASIEASRAGEHGRGFTVVASEIKALADQSKTATSQVRQILSEIQQSTNAAVLATEEGTKTVGAARNAVDEAGRTIKALEDTITDAARSAEQIAASAGQQSTGMAQIQQAMVHINQASSQNLAATRQSEEAAQNLNTLGTRLKEMLAGHDR